MAVGVFPTFYEEGKLFGSNSISKRLIQNKIVYAVDREHMNGQKYIDAYIIRDDGKLKKFLHMNREVYAPLYPGKYYFFSSKKAILDYNNVLNRNLCTVIEITDQKEQEVVLPLCYHTYDGAEKVAEYIIKEIKNNSNISNLTTSMIKLLNDLSPLSPQSALSPLPPLLKMIAYASWTLKVWPEQEWDHKPDIIGKRGEHGLKEHAVLRPLRENDIYQQGAFHKYKDFDYYYDVWSNIHFGYIGRSAGFSRSELLDGAGLAQALDDLIRHNRIPQHHDKNSLLPRSLDDIPDQQTIEIGIKLFEETGEIAERLTPFAILYKLEDLGNRNLLQRNRVKHICLDDNDYGFTPA